MNKLNIENKSINEIRKEIKDIDLLNCNEVIQLLNSDKREGVRKLGNSIKIQSKKLLEKKNRYDSLLNFDKKNKDKLIMAGTDEVGRGPLAGPVVSCVIILKDHIRVNDYIMYEINDSKKVSEKNREELYDIIIDNCVDYGIGICDNNIIDEINILNATKLSIKKAIESMKVKPELLLSDALDLYDINIKCKSIIKGDTKSLSIAAASIVAKVTRDRIMNEYDTKYPGYDFKNNKGYGTKKHLEGIKKHGVVDIHRTSFI